MSTVAVQSLVGLVKRTEGLWLKFIDECPDTIWAEKYGGWPVWQQVAHSLVTYNFFLLHDGLTPIVAPCSSEISQLKVQGTPIVSKQVMKDVLAQCEALFDSYIATLNDEDLGKEHTELSTRMGTLFTHAGCLAILAGHSMYHLGSCDAALRQNGLSGVF